MESDLVGRMFFVDDNGIDERVVSDEPGGDAVCSGFDVAKSRLAGRIRHGIGNVSSIFRKGDACKLNGNISVGIVD